MSKLDELIKKFCPDGVEYRSLGKTINLSRGVRVVRTQLNNQGKYPVYQNSMTPLGYFDESNYRAKTTFIISAGAAGSVGYSDVDFWAADDCYCLVCPVDLNSRYLYHALKNQQNYIFSQVRKASVPRIGRDVVESIKVPLPPLPVQKEIVRILDSFTELTTELTTELAARKKQYEYYRDILLTFDDEVDWKTLGEVTIKIYSGGTPKTDITEYWENGTIPWMSSGEVNLETVYCTETYISEVGLKNSSAKFVPKNSIVIALAGQGKTRGKVARIRIDLTTNQSLASLTFDKCKINPDYVFHFLKTQYENLRQISSGSGTRGGLTLQMISNYKIPIPYPNDPRKSLAEQQRIVDILDRFDTLCNDISQGLPAEIKARQQQYEYYRDKLLAFPKAELEV